MIMNKKQTIVAAFLMLGLLMAGCAQVTTHVRQNDGTYRTSKRLVFRSDLPGRSFSSEGDDMVATEFHNVTYAFPQGKGSFSKNFDEISFKGNNISCSVVERRLTINGRPAGQFDEGDRVRITGDGKVFVNGVELKTSGDI